MSLFELCVHLHQFLKEVSGFPAANCVPQLAVNLAVCCSVLVEQHRFGFKLLAGNSCQFWLKMFSQTKMLHDGELRAVTEILSGFLTTNISNFAHSHLNRCQYKHFPLKYL